ncbi:zf-HC2 domain-containing protein [Pelomonas sp. PFR6]|uniref:Zf-HC2 domain-containing protein n=1 Tax=Roseateles violae TaxID=3058042 RepID=A0ABT8DQC1_9BURK|nr:zf-HC2 domain-containing protein [Pelomonas sp. PFR6]
MTRLVLLAEEQQALPLADRIAVRLHLLACHACPRFLRQLQLMRRATERWRRYSEE